jgi:hypothetical protein
MILGGTSEALSVITGQAASIDVHASWVDFTSPNTIAPGDTNTPTISTAATTTVVGSPTGSAKRNVKHVSIRNRHASTACDITVKHTDGTNNLELFKCALSAGEELEYNEATGWLPHLASGAIKTGFDPANVAITGGTITGIQELAALAGDATHGSMNFPSGVLQTSPTIGRFEFDGKSLYFTPAGTNRGSLAPLHIRLLIADDAGGTNVNTAQPWFPTMGTLTLPAATAYRFRGRLISTRSAGAVSHTTGLLFGGTATLTFITYEALWRTGDANAAAAVNALRIAVATNTPVKAASTATTEDTDIAVDGVVLINAGGTFIPQFIYSAAPGGAPTIKAGTFFELSPIGPNTGLSLGQWS